MRRAKGSPIIVVSGLPRSGTSMAMRMLEAGGVPILTDHVRTPDADNPRGYFEFEPVKHLHTGTETGWLDSAAGQAVKIVSFLLTWLPESHDYQVLFMRRDLSEVVASQETMLERRDAGGAAAGKSAAETAQIYAAHLAQVDRFLARRTCFKTLDVSYQDALSMPRAQAERIATFLGAPLDLDAMAAAVDPALHRQRHGGQ